jgi:hypothetical protein
VQTTEIKHGDPILEYLGAVRNMSKSTEYEYRFRLNKFRHFINTEFNLSMTQLIQRLEQGILDVYHILSKYLTFLSSTSNESNLSTMAIKLHISTARGFLESQSNNIEISPRKFRLRVKIPKVIKRKML